MRLFATALFVVATLVPASAQGFRRISTGEPVADRTMPTADGKRAQLLPAGKVTVFVFVRTDHDHSESALRQLAQLEREQAGKPLQLEIVVSSGEAPAEVTRLVRTAGVKAPILIDVDDALYGELGVAMYPSAGIVGKDRKLSGFQPFRKVNYLDAMRGRVQVALGEIDEARLAKILDPDSAPIASGGRAHARVNLARRLLAAGDTNGAIANGRAALGLDPGSADAHAILAEALSKAGQCDEATKEAGLARQISPAGPPPTLACRR